MLEKAQAHLLVVDFPHASDVAAHIDAPSRVHDHDRALVVVSGHRRRRFEHCQESYSVAGLPGLCFLASAFPSAS
jgi:hypothetical protein